MGVVIIAERPDSADAMLLIEELENYLTPFYPPESRHGFSVAKLVAENVPFFVARYDGLPAGTGAIKLFGQEYGELKRMYVRPQFRGLGLAKQMVAHLESYAQSQGVQLVRLETGIYQTEAIGLYERLGYAVVPPFGDYKPDPLSLFYEKRLPT